MSTINPDQLDDQMFTIVQRELTTQRRVVQRLALLGAILMTGVVVALWSSEPRPLPMRLHLSFGIMSAIGVAWIMILGNILVRKNCPTSWDRIATAWASLVGGVAFTIASTAVCFLRGERVSTIAFVVIGSIFVAIAGLSVRAAYRWQTDLRERLAEFRRP